MIRIQERRLGSTECAAVCALYRPELALHMPKSAKTAGDVWLRLVWGLEQPSNSRMKRGNDVEAELLQCYRENVGPVWRPELSPGERWIIQHPKHDWASASPDALDANPPKSIIEIKSQSVWSSNQWGTPGTDQIPERFLYQLAWTMACVDADEWLLLAGFGSDAKEENGRTVFLYDRTVPFHGTRNLQVEAMLFEYGERFMNEYVVTRKPPPVKPTSNRRKWKAIIDGNREAEPCTEVDRSDGGGGPHPEDGA